MAALASSVVASIPTVLPLHQLLISQHFQDPEKHLAMRLHIDQTRIKIGDFVFRREED
jgi:hypothetical protein